MARVHKEHPSSDRSLHPLQKRTLLHWWINSSWRQNRYSVDLFTLNNINSPILVDNFFGYFEVDLRDTLARTVIRKMKFHFARYGLPDIVVSDNGPQFSCQEFFQFANEFNFRHQPSSPGNSQANGKAEAAVKTAKTVLKKAKASGMDVHLALLDLRNTPTQWQDTSSLGRRTRTLLPMTTNLLRPDGIAAEMIHRKLLQRQKHRNDTTIEVPNRWCLSRKEIPLDFNHSLIAKPRGPRRSFIWSSLWWPYLSSKQNSPETNQRTSRQTYLSICTISK